MTWINRTIWVAEFHRVVITEIHHLATTQRELQVIVLSIHTAYVIFAEWLGVIIGVSSTVCSTVRVRAQSADNVLVRNSRGEGLANDVIVDIRDTDVNVGTTHCSCFATVFTHNKAMF